MQSIVSDYLNNFEPFQLFGLSHWVSIVLFFALLFFLPWFAINHLSNKNIDVNIEDYSSLIKKSFSQRRKTLKNNLKRHVNVEILKDYNLKRPQELNISDYVNLYKKIYI